MEVYFQPMKNYNLFIRSEYIDSTAEVGESETIGAILWENRLNKSLSVVLFQARFHLVMDTFNPLPDDKF